MVERHVLNQSPKKKLKQHEPRNELEMLPRGTSLEAASPADESPASFPIFVSLLNCRDEVMFESGEDDEDESISGDVEVVDVVAVVVVVGEEDDNDEEEEEEEEEACDIATLPLEAEAWGAASAISYGDDEFGGDLPLSKKTKKEKVSARRYIGI